MEILKKLGYRLKQISEWNNYINAPVCNGCNEKVLDSGGLIWEGKYTPPSKDLKLMYAFGEIYTNVVNVTLASGFSPVPLDYYYCRDCVESGKLEEFAEEWQLDIPCPYSKDQ